MASLDLESLAPLQAQLSAHPIHGALRDLSDLRVFMEHHVFAVWDFMSLLKYVQNLIAPARIPWTPTGDPALRHYINQLVLEEESASLPGPDGQPWYGSHLELYCRAMDEIGADASLPGRFLRLVSEVGTDNALYSDLVPLPSRYFSETTFGFIREDKPHLVAAALTVGRERLIPEISRQVLRQVGIRPEEAPALHAYLNRHVLRHHDPQGALSLRLLDVFCAGDPQRIEEAETAAEESICARIRFWDGVLNAIETARMS